MNFGLRLDEIFETLNNKAREERASCTERNNWEGYNFTYKRLEQEAKQAIRSLTKELVAEAKPEPTKYEKYNSDCLEGFNIATDEFEQNLLKELEEA